MTIFPAVPQSLLPPAAPGAEHEHVTPTQEVPGLPGGARPQVPYCNPNVTINGWCGHCEQWAVRCTGDLCGFCGTLLELTPAIPEHARKRRRRAAA